MSNNGENKQTIFEAYYDVTTKQIGIKLYTNSPTGLTLALKRLDMTIENELLRQDMESSKSKIIPVKDSLNNFLKKRR